MEAKNVRAEQVSETRERILTTAERLFAEQGIHAVSNRQVSEAAGQGNNAAVGYHFGTKSDLLAAIARKHSAQIELMRNRMLAEIGESPTLEVWMACLVRPSTEHLEALGSPTWYARFMAQLTTDPALQGIIADQSLTSPSLQRIIDGFMGCLPELPAEVLVERAAMSRHLIAHTIADRERALAENGSTPRSSWHDTATGLIDVLVAMWQAPVSPSG